MTWAIGSEVVVRTLGNKRGVVVEAGRGGRYRVQVEGVTTACREDDLGAPPSARSKKRTSASRARLEHPDTSARDEAAPSGRVDLHGLRVDDAIARVMDEIDSALRRGADRVEVDPRQGIGARQGRAAPAPGRTVGCYCIRARPTELRGNVGYF